MAGSGPGERFRYHRALRGLLELLAGERRVALVLDDPHWADEASLEFVLHLLRRPPRTACALVSRCVRATGSRGYWPPRA
jgi:predicted ATPase